MCELDVELDLEDDLLERVAAGKNPYTRAHLREELSGLRFELRKIRHKRKLEV